MSRVTDSMLDNLARQISTVLGDEHEIIRAYGNARLYRDGGAVEVSPRLASGPLYDWMHAYLAGIDAGRKEQN